MVNTIFPALPNQNIILHCRFSRTLYLLDDTCHSCWCTRDAVTSPSASVPPLDHVVLSSRQCMLLLTFAGIPLNSIMPVRKKTLTHLSHPHPNIIYLCHASLLLILQGPGLSCIYLCTLRVPSQCPGERVGQYLLNY